MQEAFEVAQQTFVSDVRLMETPQTTLLNARGVMDLKIPTYPCVLPFLIQTLEMARKRTYGPHVVKHLRTIHTIRPHPSDVYSCRRQHPQARRREVDPDTAPNPGE